MLRLCILGTGDVNLIENGKVYKFDFFGNPIPTTASDSWLTYMNGAYCLPVLSVLHSQGGLSLGAYFLNDMFKEYKCSLSPQDCVNRIKSLNAHAKILRRNGVSNGIAYNQLIFIFRKDVNLNSVLKVLI